MTIFNNYKNNLAKLKGPFFLNFFHRVILSFNFSRPKKHERFDGDLLKKSIRFFQKF